MAWHDDSSSGGTSFVRSGKQAIHDSRGQKYSYSISGLWILSLFCARCWPGDLSFVISQSLAVATGGIYGETYISHDDGRGYDMSDCAGLDCKAQGVDDEFCIAAADRLLFGCFACSYGATVHFGTRYHVFVPRGLFDISDGVSRTGTLGWACIRSCIFSLQLCLADNAATCFNKERQSLSLPTCSTPVITPRLWMLY
jgi:hypothetical protein